MDKKVRVKIEIEKNRQILNNKLLPGVLNEEILNISCKLDELIVDYMKLDEQEIEYK